MQKFLSKNGYHKHTQTIYEVPESEDVVDATLVQSLPGPLVYLGPHWDVVAEELQMRKNRTVAKDKSIGHWLIGAFSVNRGAK
jgi:hypothetical protein